MGEEYLHAELTGRIIGAAFAVHGTLGTGFLESVYENALCVELAARGIPHERQVQLVVNYRGQPVGHYIADVVADGRVIVEVKAVSKTTEAHEAQLVNYLAATGMRVGLLLNFGEQSLKPCRRVR